MASPFRCRAFWLPKHGHTVEEYEDSWAADENRGRFAVADGATESSFAREWAQLLTGDFVHYEGDDVAGWLARAPDLQRLWWESVSPRPLPWYGEEKRQEGAFATFLGLALTPEGSWQALAVGDSCLFQVRGGELLMAMPLAHAEGFDSVPWLLSSRRAPSDEWLAEAAKTARGEWSAGDQFWLLTDAVAECLLAGHKTDSSQPLSLAFESSDDAFAEWVAAERGSGRMRNDDCTWVVIDAT
jgi:hypothetical protein